MILGHKLLSRYRKDQKGATAIEVAVVFPILILCLFTVLGIGTFMYGGHQAQRTVEATARQARVISSPTQTELETLLKANTEDTIVGTYSPSVRMISQFDGSYAELVITYDFKLNMPLMDRLVLQSKAVTQVKLRDMPA